MAYLGRFNRLLVNKLEPHGAYLEASWMGNVLLPKRYVPDDIEPGDYIGAFLYQDSEDRYIATTQRPKAQVGEVAYLKVEEVNKVGAFLDWGLPKQLLVPFSQQQKTMAEGKSYLVYLYVDEATNRIAASSKLNKFIERKPSGLEKDQQVSLTVSERTDLGYVCVINNQCWGLLFYDDVVKPLKIGQNVKGYIRQIREDGKVDLSLQKSGFAKVDDFATRLMRELNDNDGFIGLSDKSHPKDIYERFGVSKKTYKMTIGNLYKKRLITIETHGIRLIESSGDA